MKNGTDMVIATTSHGDNYRTADDSRDTLHSTLLHEKQRDINTNDIIRNTYRYKFTDEFTKELYIFSKIHQYDHRKYLD